MAVASAYSNHIYDSKPLEYKIDSDFIKNIADTQSQMYEQAYAKIEGFKSKVLNLSTLNPYANQKIEGYNKKIEEYFKTNNLKNANLSNQKIVNGFMSVFNEIDNDTELQAVYNTSNELKKVNNEFKESLKKDKQVQDNYLVWQKEHLEQFQKEFNLKKASSISTGSFNPYYDYTKEITGLKNLVHFDGQKYSIKDNQGGIQTFDIKQVTPEKLKGLIESGLSGAAINQLMTEGKARFYQNPTFQTEEGLNAVREGLYQEEVNHITNIKNNHQTEIEQLKGKQKFLQGKQNKTEEEEKLLSSIPSLIEQRNQAISGLPTINKNEYLKKDYYELAQYAGVNHQRNKITTLANKMAWQQTQISNDIDKAFWKNKEYAFDVNKENLDTEKWKAEFGLKERELARKERNDELDYNASMSKIKGKDGTTIDNPTGLPLIEVGEGDIANKTGLTFYPVSPEEKAEYASGKLKTIDDEISSLNEVIRLKDAVVTEEDVRKALFKDKDKYTPLDVKLVNFYYQYGENMSAAVAAVQNDINNENGSLHQFITESINKKNVYEDMKNRAHNMVYENHYRNASVNGKDISRDDYRLQYSNTDEAKGLANKYGGGLMTGTMSKKYVLPTGEKAKPYIQKAIAIINKQLSSEGIVVSDKTIDESQIVLEGDNITFNFTKDAFKDEHEELNGTTKTVKAPWNLEEPRNTPDSWYNTTGKYEFTTASNNKVYHSFIKAHIEDKNLKMLTIQDSNGNIIKTYNSLPGSVSAIKEQADAYIKTLK